MMRGPLNRGHLKILMRYGPDLNARAGRAPLRRPACMHVCLYVCMYVM